MRRCSIATSSATGGRAGLWPGFYAALLNRFLFRDRKPSWPLALAIGMVAEVLHLLLVLLTHLDDAKRAFDVVMVCTVPMISCNGLAVALAGAAIALASGGRIRRGTGPRDISQKIQAGMLGVVAIGFAITVGFTFVVQQGRSVTETTMTLSQAISDVTADVRTASDENLLNLTIKAARAVRSVEDSLNMDLKEVADSLGVHDIHVIDEDGIIVASTDDTLIGFDMASGEQSAEFLCLLDNVGAKSFVQDYQPMTADSTQWHKFAGVRLEGGFIQAGYDAADFTDDLASEVRSAVRNRHVGTDGFLCVLDENNVMVAMRSDISVGNVNAAMLAQASSGVEPGTLFTAYVNGTEHYAMYEDGEGLRIYVLIPVSEAQFSRDLSILMASFMEVLVFAALFAAIYVLIANVVVTSIWEVNGTLNKITSGDLEAKVEVRDSKEFASLSDDINRTVHALRDAIAAEGARIEADLATAKAIQGSALPTTFPPFPEVDAFDIYASMNAAREVGGDFYDFFLIDDHTLGFLIADVSGKGIPASLFMMAAKSELANYMKSGMDLGEAVHSANVDLCEGNEAGMFVTVWAARLDFKTGHLTYVNAGHNPPLLRHDGQWQWLKQKGGLFLGTFESARYRTATLDLAEGDEILLYTDGVNEAFSLAGEEYGNDRLEAFLVADVRAWARGAEQSDDITMVCLEYGTPPEVSGTIEVDATPAGLDELRRALHFELAQLSCPESAQYQIDIAVEELFSNTCKYGYPEAAGKVRLSYIYNARPSKLTVTLTDWGIQFDPLGYDRTDEVGDFLKGMGIHLAVNYVDDISYVRDEDRNVVAFTKSW